MFYSIFSVLSDIISIIYRDFFKRTEDQKLIYSGQLLPDSVTLRDILRWYEGQETHTVHLVCSPPRDLGKQKKFHPHVKMSEDCNVPSSVPPSGL